VQYRMLGRTNMEVSVICCGTMAMCPHPTYGEPDDEESIAAVHAALDAGVNFFDTAEGYGDGYAEDILGRALEGKREEAIVATKVSRANLCGPDLTGACERSLQRLRSDYVDLYQVHWPNHDVPFSETAGALEDLREQGKLRAWGVSNFGRLDLSDALEVGRPVANQVPYSLLWRAVEHEITPVCVAQDVSIVCYSPLAQGVLTGKFRNADEVPEPRKRARYCKGAAMALSFAVVDELRSISLEIGESTADIALAWVLARPGVAAAVAGARDRDQVADNAAAGNLELPAGVVERLSLASQPLKDALDANPDMWQEGAESRYR